MSLFRAKATAEAYSDEEANARMPIWCAFAELFLDTEQTAQDYRRIAETVSGRGFDQAALLAILSDEVAPAFAHNIFIDIAGEWAGWPEDYVRQRVQSVRQNGSSWLLPGKDISAYIGQEWAKVECYLV